MYVPESKVASFLDISIMQLRFILESDSKYKYIIKNSSYYVKGSCITLLKKDIESSRAEFRKRLEDGKSD